MPGTAARAAAPTHGHLRATSMHKVTGGGDGRQARAATSCSVTGHCHGPGVGREHVHIG